MVTVNLAEAKARLSELVERALAGEEVIISRRNEPLLRLEVLDTAKTRPRFGRLRGRIELAEDFDAPLDDFSEYTGEPR